MKKLLILAYDFPPYVSVGGLRPYSWYKQLKEFGIYPVVITRQWANKYGNSLDYIEASESDKTIIEQTEFGTLVKTPYKPNLSNQLLLKYGESQFKLIRKTITAFYEFGQFVLSIGPKSNIYTEAYKYLKQNKVDCIIASGDPFILHKYGTKLASIFNIPFIGDYRDLWSQDPSMKNSLILKKWSRYFEKRTIKKANVITTVSLYLNEQLKRINPSLHPSIIANGYDIGIVKNAIQNKTTTLSIAYAGSLYNWHPLETFLRVCNEVVKNKSINLSINFYGTDKEESIKKLVKTKYGSLNKSIHVFSKLPLKILNKQLIKHNVLLLYNDYYFLGTKIFNYLALKKQILFCFSEDKEATAIRKKHYPMSDSLNYTDTLQSDLIHETNSGIIVENSKHLKQVLLDLYREHQKMGFIECKSIGIEKYSRKEQTKKLAKLIHKVIEENK